MAEERDAATALIEAVANARDAAAQCARPDLAARVDVALRRAARPSTVVCVVGEFKQGKSSLVNALLGGRACPVDDDLATSVVTVVHHHDEPRVVVRRREGEQAIAEEVAPSELAALVTEAGNPGNERRLERVDVGIPHPMLAVGLTLVDTPGMGGLGAGTAAMTLAFLPYADALLFVTDASAELSAPELELLRQAAERCPSITVVLTKTDLYPEWRRIAELDAAHLARAGVEVEIVPVSSHVRLVAAERGDDALAEESGIPRLAEGIGTVLATAKGVAARRAGAEAAGTLAQLRDGYAGELGVLEDPSTGDAASAELADAAARLERLRGVGSRWSVVLNDRMTDLGGQANHTFRGAMRTLLRSAEEQIEAIDDDDGWDALGRQLQTEVSTVVADVVAVIERGVQDTHEAVAALLAEELGEIEPSTRGSRIDVSSLWRSQSAESTTAGQRFFAGLSVVRGAQGGIFMMSMMGRFMPAAAASVLLANPVMAGFGILFAGQAIADQRKRKLAARRQQVRTSVRQFLDDVQFEAGNELAELLREAQRSLRDQLTDRITELQRTCTETAARAKEAAAAEAAQRTERTAEVRNRLAVLERLERDLAEARAAAGVAA